MLTVMEEFQKEGKDAATSRGRRVTNVSDEKNATPGDGAGSPETCLDDIRPNTLSLGRSAAALTDPATDRLNGFGSSNPEADAKQEDVLVTGDLTVKSKLRMENMWHSAYPSQVLPFVIPKMVSGSCHLPHTITFFL